MSVNIDVYRKQNGTQGNYSELVINLDSPIKFLEENIGEYKTPDAMYDIIIKKITSNYFQVGKFFLTRDVRSNNLALHCSINMTQTPTDKKEIFFYEYRIYTRNQDELSVLKTKLNQGLKNLGGVNGLEGAN